MSARSAAKRLLLPVGAGVITAALATATVLIGGAASGTPLASSVGAGETVPPAALTGYQEPPAPGSEVTVLARGAGPGASTLTSVGYRTSDERWCYGWANSPEWLGSSCSDRGPESDDVEVWGAILFPTETNPGARVLQGYAPPGTTQVRLHNAEVDVTVAASEASEDFNRRSFFVAVLPVGVGDVDVDALDSDKKVKKTKTNKDLKSIDKSKSPKDS